MSTFAQRSAASRTAAPMLSLAERLQAAGITVLDDETVANMRKAVEYNLHPETTPEELAEHIARGNEPVFAEWTTIDYGIYCMDHQRQREYGGLPPPAVIKKVGEVRHAVPEADVVVYCVPEDPFVRVVKDDERCWVAAWSPLCGFCMC